MPEVVYSIIIPHYNIPDLLLRCIRSIPVREDFQIIVVDDCSPCQKEIFQMLEGLKHPYLEYYSTPVGGSAGRARNVGIAHARGRWLTFLDADDLFVQCAGDILDNYKNHSEDVLYFQSVSVMCDDITQKSGRHCFLYHFDHYFKTGDELPLRLEFDAPWGKFVKKSLIDKYHIRFDEVRYSNDTYFSAAIGVYANSIGVPEEVLYVVTEREGSLTAGKMNTIHEWETRYHSALHVQEFFDQNNVGFKRYAFNDFIVFMWNRDKLRCMKEFMKLSWKNKQRVIYCMLRSVKQQ